MFNGLQWSQLMALGQQAHIDDPVQDTLVLIEQTECFLLVLQILQHLHGQSSLAELHQLLLQLPEPVELHIQLPEFTLLALLQMIPLLIEDAVTHLRYIILDLFRTRDHPFGEH